MKNRASSGVFSLTQSSASISASVTNMVDVLIMWALKSKLQMTQPPTKSPGAASASQFRFRALASHSPSCQAAQPAQTASGRKRMMAKWSGRKGLSITLQGRASSPQIAVQRPNVNCFRLTRAQTRPTPAGSISQ